MTSCWYDISELMALSSFNYPPLLQPNNGSCATKPDSHHCLLRTAFPIKIGIRKTPTNRDMHWLFLGIWGGLGQGTVLGRIWHPAKQYAN